MLGVFLMFKSAKKILYIFGFWSIRLSGSLISANVLAYLMILLFQMFQFKLRIHHTQFQFNIINRSRVMTFAFQGRKTGFQWLCRPGTTR